MAWQVRVRRVVMYFVGFGQGMKVCGGVKWQEEECARASLGEAGTHLAKQVRCEAIRHVMRWIE